MTSYCPLCLAPVRTNARYCSHCGNSLFQIPYESEFRKSGQDLELGQTHQSGYRSLLRETSYLAPEYQAKFEAALSPRQTTALARVPAHQPANRQNRPINDHQAAINRRLKVTRRNAVVVMFLPYLTFGLFSLYWWWRTGQELRQALKGREPNTLRDICLLILTGGLWRLVMHYNYAARIGDLQELNHLPRSDYLKIVCPLLSACWLGFIGLGLMQRELNKLSQLNGYEC